MGKGCPAQLGGSEKIGVGAKTTKNPYNKGFFNLKRSQSKEKFTLFDKMIKSPFFIPLF